MPEVSVISSDLDGAELRRKKGQNSRYLRCDGHADDGEINEAIAGVGRRQFRGLGAAWERIFGKRQMGGV